MEESFGYNWGLVLRKGTKDKLVFRINDDLSGLSILNFQATGIRYI